jgi:hypothetical protein
MAAPAVIAAMALLVAVSASKKQRNLPAAIVDSRL